MKIKTKFKLKQKVWCLWMDVFEYEYKPRKATIIEIKEPLDGLNVYRLHYDDSKIDFCNTEDFIFATKEEAQKECDKRNGKGGE